MPGWAQLAAGLPRRSPSSSCRERAPEGGSPQHRRARERHSTSAGQLHSPSAARLSGMCGLPALAVVHRPQLGADLTPPPPHPHPTRPPRRHLQAASRARSVKVCAVDPTLTIAGSTAAMLAVGRLAFMPFQVRQPPLAAWGHLPGSCAAMRRTAPRLPRPRLTRPPPSWVLQRRKVTAAVNESGPKTTGGCRQQLRSCLQPALAGRARAASQAGAPNPNHRPPTPGCPRPRRHHLLRQPAAGRQLHHHHPGPRRLHADRCVRMVRGGGPRPLAAPPLPPHAGPSGLTATEALSRPPASLCTPGRARLRSPVPPCLPPTLQHSVS